MSIEFKLPELGENISAADVVNVLVKPGDTIARDQAVLEMETEKAVLELPCPHTGTIETIHVKAGDHISVGAVVLTLKAADGAPAGEPARPAPAAQAKPRAPQALDQPAPARSEQQIADDSRESEGANITPPAVAGQESNEHHAPAPASPAIRRLAREMGIDLSQVKGSGPAGRITEEDVHEYVRQLASGQAAPSGAAAGTPALPDFAQWGPIERQPISNIRRKTAESMTAAWRMVPQVTQYDQCDVTDLEAHRKRYVQAKGDKSPKITMTAILLKAVVAALREFPKFNASFDMQAGQIVFKKYYHIGVAVDTDNGLLVPVIRDVDRKSIAQLAKELDDLANKARQRKLGLEDMRGSCFTITNLGGIGGTAFSPIVYWPEVAILGVARARQEQVVRDGRADVRLMLPLCLSYDHRVIDGADGARFTRRLAGILSDPLALFMEA